ncbi:MAG TPA: PHP domain-containing protein, partial [Daejeonella sp.]|nr:PHP domain-containing protein [Daejeonella sp.]
MYINCKTYFSYRYGTYSTQALVDEAADLGIRSLALTNINGTPDAWDFVDFCRLKNIKPLLGSEVRNGSKFLYILLAKNNAGFMYINRFISDHKRTKSDYPERPEGNEDVYVIYSLGNLPPDQLSENELISVKPGELNKLLNIPVHKYPAKFVIRQPVTIQNKTYYNLHRLLRAIDQNTLLSKLLPEDVASPDERDLAEAELMSQFRAFPAMIARTIQLTEECSITMELGSDKNKRTYTGSLEGDRSLLHKLALEGVHNRYGKGNKEIAERVKKELKVINDMHFNAYYLIVWDVIRYARSRNFFYVGRGSGANSIIAYALQITEVDPISLDLYFERFLNKHRSSPPDFDIDFSHTDRDEVIDYIFKRHGKEHVALLGMYSTFQRKAIIRELGKVLGLPKAEIDQLVANNKSTFG